MNRAIGMVIAMEKVPHGDLASALTTTSASTASRMIMMANTAISAAAPPTGPISSRAICPRLRAVAAHGEEQHHHVLHGAGEDDPDDDPDRAGQVAHLGREHRPDQRRRAPAIAAKWWPNSTRRSVGWKSMPLSRRSAGVARVSSTCSTFLAMNRA